MKEKRTVAITGAASGVGRALSYAFAAAECNVVLADIADASFIAKEINASGGDAFYIPCDVAKRADVDSMVEAAVERYQSISLLVNNAGVFPFSDIESIEDETLDRVFSVNVKGPFMASRAVVPYMKAKGGGRIINIGSSTFFCGLENASAYVASKGALIGMTRALATELGRDNIQINTVTLGLTKTEGVLASGVNEEFFDQFSARQCLKETIFPEDIVDLVVFLGIGNTRFVTGQTINIDGGLGFN